MLEIPYNLNRALDVNQWAVHSCVEDPHCDMVNPRVRAQKQEKAVSHDSKANINF